MKKEIAKYLKKVASRLPQIFEEQPDTVLMSGKELKLTPIADQMELIDDEIYSVPIPKFVAVLHDQQVKDAYKRNGMDGVKEYCLGVIKKYKAAVIAADL